MTEKILVSSMINGTELVRSLALRGTDSFAFRVLSSVEMADIALIRCGKIPAGKRVSVQEQQFIIGEFMRRVDYFTGASSVLDAVNLADTLNEMRKRFVSEEADGLHRALPAGEFRVKNRALLEVYDLYISWLAQNDRYDDISLIRTAAETADKMNAEFLLSTEFALTPLENALVTRLSGGKVKMVSLQELYGKEESFSLRLDSMTRVYGAANEVDRLVRDIRDAGVPLDRCTVATADPAAYGQLFFDLFTEKGLPVAFGCGVAVSNTRPAGLLNLWEKWNSIGFHGADALEDMLYSDTFDRSVLLDLLNSGRAEEECVSLRRLTALAGSMRLEVNEKINEERIDAWEKTLSESSEDLKLVKPLRCLGRELALPCAAFLNKYALIRKHPEGGPMDQSGLHAILDVLSLAGRYPGPFTAEQLIPNALGQSVYAKTAESGKLFVTSVTGALCAMRDHLYIVGLSADRFPGKPAENALMLDSDWELLPCPETAPTSRRRVKANLDGLMLLVRLAASLGIDVHVYWPDYDPAQMKELIPSSVVYRLLDEFPNVKEEKEGFFPAVYSDAYAVGKMYMDGEQVSPENDSPVEREIPVTEPEKREWSPTAIDFWYGCKRAFQYKYLLNLNIDEEDDPMVIAPENVIGNMAHHLMEILAEEKLTGVQFHALASAMFDEFLTARPPMDWHAAEREKERFVRMMDDARRTDPGREVVSAEEEIRCTLPSGLRLKGRPDRIEAVGNGKYIVVDFKTGRKIMQKRNDAKTCRQTLIYAWMLREKGMETELCEYRYLRHPEKSIPCETHPAIMTELEEDLARFYNGLITEDFAPEDGYGKKLKSGDCTFCRYKKICMADKTREEASV